MSNNAEYGEELDFFNEQQYFEEAEYGSESGICSVCKLPYHKNIGQSNLSRSGQCWACGYNP